MDRDDVLHIPQRSEGIIVFAHGSGSGRHSPRSQSVAGKLNEDGLATLLLDLLTADEEEIDSQTRQLRFDIDLLSKRLIAAIDWITNSPDIKNLTAGLFGASTGAAAALIAAAERPDVVSAIVSRFCWESANLAVIATGLSLAITATWNIVVSESPEEFIGISTAVAALLIFIGMATGPSIAGVYMEIHSTIEGIQGSYPTLGSYNLVFLTSGLLSGISLGFAIVLNRRGAHKAI